MDTNSVKSKRKYMHIKNTHTHRQIRIHTTERQNGADETGDTYDEESRKKSQDVSQTISR